MRIPVFYGWVIVALAFVTTGIGVNARTSFSLLFPPILDEFHWDRGVTAGAFSFGFLMSAAFAPLIGWLMDHRGPRLVIEIGVVLVAAGLALAPLVTVPWHLYLTLGFLVGGGSVCIGYTGHALFLPNWFVRRRGLAVGIAFSGVGVGSVTLLPWVQALIDTVGWRTACLVLAAVVFGILAPLNLLLRRRPEDLGLLPDGDLAVATAQGGEADDNVVDPEWAATDWTLGRALRTARFWWLALSYHCILFAWYAVLVHQTKYLMEIGFSSATAALALGLVGFAGILGQILLGHLSDRLGREWVWTLGAAGFVLCYVVLLVMREHPTLWLLYLMVAAQGVLGYGLASLFPAIPAEIFKGRHFGTIFGTIQIATIAGGAVGPWITGALYDRTGSYASAFSLAILYCLISIAAIWLASPSKVRAVAGRVGTIAKGDNAARRSRRASQSKS
jgi:MFS family permease